MNLCDLQTFMASNNNVRFLNIQELTGPTRIITLALVAIHDSGYVHNDIQPANILINTQMESILQLSLGGFSRCVKAEENRTRPVPMMSDTNEYSYLYRAPEVILSRGMVCSGASDVWSLGVTLYVLATGRFPFCSEFEIVSQPVTWNDAEMLKGRSNMQFKSLIT